MNRDFDLDRPLTKVEADVCKLVINTPDGHSAEHPGCPVTSLYVPVITALKQEPTSLVLKDIDRSFYDDGRCCPMPTLKWYANEYMKYYTEPEQ